MTENRRQDNSNVIIFF